MGPQRIKPSKIDYIKKMSYDVVEAIDKFHFDNKVDKRVDRKKFQMFMIRNYKNFC